VGAAVTEKRYQVFVSSTYLDLVKERQKITEALYEADRIPIGMEMFPSTSESSMALIERLIKQSDFYILVIGSRYGSMYRNRGISYTEHEFELAKKHKKNPLVFIYNGENGYISDEDEETKSKLDAFKSKAGIGNPAYCQNPDDLARKITNALNVEEKKSGSHQSGGWIRADAENVVLVMADELSRPQYYRDLRNRAKKSIFIMGAGLSQVSVDRDTLTAQLRKGVNIRILGIDSEYSSTELHKDTIDSFFSSAILSATNTSFSKRASDASQAIVSFVSDLREMNLKGTFEYRVFKFIPTTNLTVIDENEKYGSMVYEHILPGNRRVLFHDVTASKFAFKKLLPDHEEYWRLSRVLASSK
jgi:hypothetical protein